MTLLLPGLANWRIENNPPLGGSCFATFANLNHELQSSFTVQFNEEK
jgi:hypothetical protein